MSLPDAQAAADAGADAIGMILHANAKRLISVDLAGQIARAMPPYVTPVGVFVDLVPARVIEIARQVGLSTVQFHGNETLADIQSAAPLKIIKAIRVDRATIRPVLAEWRDAYQSGKCDNLIGILLESAVKGASGGTGVENDFDLIDELQQSGAFAGLPPIILSGGLTPDNVGAQVTRLRPYGVDVSSGIESTFGIKSVEKMTRFVANASRC